MCDAAWIYLARTENQIGLVSNAVKWQTKCEMSTQCDGQGTMGFKGGQDGEGGGVAIKMTIKCTHSSHNKRDNNKYTKQKWNDCKHVKHQRKYLNKYLRSMHKHEHESSWIEQLVKIKFNLRPTKAALRLWIVLITFVAWVATPNGRGQFLVSVKWSLSDWMTNTSDISRHVNWKSEINRETLNSNIEIFNDAFPAYFSWHLQFKYTCIAKHMYAYNFNCMQTFVQQD